MPFRGRNEDVLLQKKREEEKGVAISQSKFEILSNRVMQYEMEERIVRSMRMAAVKCFRYGEEGHKYRKCPL